MTTDRKLRSEVRSLLQDAAQEMGFAVDSIRNEVIEKAWFGEELTPEAQSEWLRGDHPETDVEKAQNFKREDVYGHDPAGHREFEHPQDSGLER